MGKTGRRIVLLLAACALAASPAPAGAAPGTGGTAAPEATAVPPFTATPNVLAGRYARFRGFLPARNAGRSVGIDRYDEPTATWVPLASATVAADGSYSARWRADVTGVLRTRALLRSDG